MRCLSQIRYFPFHLLFYGLTGLYRKNIASPFYRLAIFLRRVYFITLRH